MNVNCVEDERGLTALHWAAKLGHVRIVRLLLADDRVDVNYRSQTGGTALHIAAENGHAEVVQLLLGSDKIDVNSKDEYGRTPMNYAMLQTHFGIIELLLADPRLADEDDIGNGSVALGKSSATRIINEAYGAAAGDPSGESDDPRKSCWLCYAAEVELSVCKGCKKVRNLFMRIPSLSMEGCNY